MYAKGTLTGNLGTVDKPVTVLPTALVGANSAGVNHSDGVVPIKGDGRVKGSQRKVRSVRDFCSTIQSQKNGE